MKPTKLFKRILRTIENAFTRTSNNLPKSSQTNSDTQNVSVNKETTVSTLLPTTNDVNAVKNGGIIIVNNGSNNQTTLYQ